MTGETTFTDDELAGLSPEERAAVAAPEDADGTATDAGSGTDAEDPDFGAHVPDAGGEGAGAAAAAGGEGDGDGGDAGAEAAAADDDAQHRNAILFPEIKIEGPADFEALMKTFGDERSAIVTKFKEGEIGVDDLLSQTHEVDQRIAALREHNLAANLASEFTTQGKKQAAQDLWQREQDTFMDDHQEYNNDPILRSALNAAVVTLARDPENRRWTGAKVLEEAHKQVHARFSQPSAGDKPTDKPTDKQPSEAAKKTEAARRPDLASLPRTLGGLPPADVSSTGQDEFAALDSLSGVELENALAKLTPEQESRYLRAGA